jgi:subtilisin family serine protease
MDPALQEQLLPARDGGEVIEAIIRLQAPFRIPDNVKVVSQFGDIITVRVRRSDVPAVYQSPAVRSFKAKRVLNSFHSPAVTGTRRGIPESAGALHPSGGGVTGKGVVVAILDWGADFAHGDFLNDDGSTRFLAIWDQSGQPTSPHKYGYGRVFSQAQINQALQSESPYQTLGYLPSEGSHGTLVAGIAAGNGRSGSRGIAPGADLVFVHLSTNERMLNPRLDLGDSVGLLEALDFVRVQAGERPLVVNMSLGAHGGSHDGNSLVELAMDNFLASRPNTMICQSVGNYYSSKTHHNGRVLPGRSAVFNFRIHERANSDHELEVWHGGQDLFEVHLRHLATGIGVVCRDESRVPVILDGQEAGRLYYRLHEPNTGKNHINLFLDKNAPAGVWEVTLHGKKVADGRYDAWIERNNGRNKQAIFERRFVSPLTSNGTICNGYNSIVVGAVDSANKPTGFSSSGPTTDGRSKPDIVAPGEKIGGPKADPLAPKGHLSLKKDTGTSFSTPQVTGTVALMLELVQNPTASSTLRTLLLSAATPLHGLDSAGIVRTGSGLLNIPGAVAAMRIYQSQLRNQKNTMQNGYFDNYLEQVFPATTGNAGTVFLRASLPDGRNLPYNSSPPITFSNLDDALRNCLVSGRSSCVIKGNLFGGGAFTVHELYLPLCPITPPVIRFQPASSDICCLVLDGYAPYFPSNAGRPADRWEQFPDLSAFYAQSQAIQTNQRSLWLRKMFESPQTVNQHITIGGARPAAAQVNAWSAPEIRLMLVQFAEHLFPVRDIDQDRNGHRWIGAGMNGATLINMPIPLSEPNCYLKVISNREGQLESINAYDGGAGISLGTVQFNAQNKALHKFLWKVWQQDNDLFLIAFAPLGWTMEAEANGDPVLIISHNGAAPIRIRSAEKDRFINYLHSGDPAVSTRRIPFRRSVTTQFRLLVVRPHIQAMINEIAVEIYAVPGLEAIHRSGIPALDVNNPSLELFQLKSALLSAYVRATGCAANLIRALRAYGSVHEKLAHLHQQVDHLSNIGRFNCANALRDRLRAQVQEAQAIFNEVLQSLPNRPATTTSTRATTPSMVVESHDEQAESYFEDVEQSIWQNWQQQDAYSEAEECNCP